MRKRLEETRKDASIRDSLRVIRRNIETLFWMLSNTNTSASTSSSGGGSGFSVDVVETLPPIPTAGYRVVFWSSTGSGVGDDQLWEAYSGQSRWYPCQKPTTLSGAPGT